MAPQSMSSMNLFIGRRIRQLRWVHGVSKADLARRLGVEQEQIKAYENGSIRISAARLFHVSEVMNVPVTAFFEGMGVSPEPGQTAPRKIPSTREAQMLSHFSLLSDRQQ